MANTDPYTPIACGLVDELEASIVLRKRGEIVYTTPEGDSVSLADGRAVDWKSEADGEFLILEDGTRVRMDRIVSYLGKPFTGRAC